MVNTLMMVTFNRLDLTKITVDNLFKVLPKDCNLVIVDNGSNDGTREYLKSLKNDDIKIIIHFFDKNMGIARGRNMCLKLANDLSTDNFCTIDNDVIVPYGFFEECVEIMTANRSYGMIGVNMEGKRYPSVTKNGHTFQDKPAGNLGTACIVFPKSTHQLLGFFNTTDYSNFYGLEDSDFGMRARFAGLKLGYIDRMGDHFGVGENDTGEYREFKTKEHDKHVKKFKENCALYAQRKKPIHVPYKA